MIEAMNLSEGIYLPLKQIVYDSDRHKNDGVQRDSPLFDILSLEKMYEICLLKIESAEKSIILNHYNMFQLLYYWIEISNVDTIKSWIKANIQTNEETLFFLEKLITSQGKNVGYKHEKVYWGIHYKVLEDFFDLTELKNLIQIISNNLNLTKDQKKIIDFFNVAMKRKDEGKEDTFFRDELV